MIRRNRPGLAMTGPLTVGALITLRKSEDRAHADPAWLQSAHRDSFAGHDDPAHRGGGKRLVINEDRVAAGAGLGTHGHPDMSIIRDVHLVRGELEVNGLALCAAGDALELRDESRLILAGGRQAVVVVVDLPP